MLSHTPSLSDEIVLLIFEEVSQVAPKSLLDLCLVSRRFSRLTSSIIYQSIWIPASHLRDIDSPSTTWYSFQDNAIAYSREITIKEAVDWVLLAGLLSKMNRLDSVTWEFWGEPLPIVITDTLHRYWPNVQLHIEDVPIGNATDLVNVYQPVVAGDFADRLNPCRNITSIKADIMYEEPGAMRRFKQLLMSCINLDILHLRLPCDHEGRTNWASDGNGIYNLGVESEDKLTSPLKELIYHNRGGYTGRNNYIPISFFDLSQLRRLELRGHHMISFTRALQGKIKHLDTLSIEYFCFGESYDFGRRVLEDFISSIRGLKNLRLVNPTLQFPISVLCLHGQTLQNLSIRHPRRGNEPYSMIVKSKPYLPIQLDELNDFCPHLCSMALDMEMLLHRLPYDTLAAIARFPNLHTLNLNAIFDHYSSYDEDRAAYIKTDLLTVRHIFTYTKHLKTGVPFQRFDVMLGDYPRNLAHRRQPGQNERPNVLFRCRVDDDEKDVVDYDVEEEEDPGWRQYFEEAPLNGKPGQTYPSNLEDLLAAGEEADAILAEAHLYYEEDQDSLFGSSSESEVQV